MISAKVKSCIIFRSHVSVHIMKLWLRAKKGCQVESGANTSIKKHEVKIFCEKSLFHVGMNIVKGLKQKEKT